MKTIKVIKVIKKISYIPFNIACAIMYISMIASYFNHKVAMIDLSAYVALFAVIYMACDRWEDRLAKKETMKKR